MIIVMSNYYLFKSGTLSRKNNTLLFETISDEKKVIPINNVDDIFLFGKIKFNTDLITFIYDMNINLHIFDYYNNYKGTFLSKKSVNSGQILINQVNKYNTDRLFISRKILESSKYNIVQNLKLYNLDVSRFEKLSFDDCDSINSIMGVEGNIRKLYYSEFKNITNRYKMTKRTKRPPHDEINSMISFGNMLCYSECIRAINKVGLSKDISYLHDVKSGRNSLSLDLSEILKPIIVDRIIFKLINNNIIKDSHFDKNENICYLSKNGAKIFVKEWDDKLNSSFFHKNYNRNVSYRELFKFEAYKLLKYVTEGGEYKPLKMWW